jgi:hypothetical protein
VESSGNRFINEEINGHKLNEEELIVPVSQSIGGEPLLDQNGITFETSQGAPPNRTVVGHEKHSAGYIPMRIPSSGSN